MEKACEITQSFNILCLIMEISSYYENKNYGDFLL